MKALYAALLKAQQEFEKVPQDGKNTHLNNRYATLTAVQEAAIPVLNKHGLVALPSARTDWQTQPPIVNVGLAIVHAESGEMIQQELGLVPVKPDPQGIGSAISYGRRYLLMTMLGLSEADDDGNAASGKGNVERPAQPLPQKRPPAKQAAPQPVDEDFGDQSADNAPITETMLKTVHASLGELYRGMKAEEIDEKRHALVRWATKGRTTSSKALTVGEAMTLLEAIGEKLRAQKAAQPELVAAGPVYQ